MVLSTENSILHKAVGDRKSIEILAGAGFDAIDYTFTPFMEEGDPAWDAPQLLKTAKELRMIAEDNGIFFNQAHSPFRFRFQDGFKPDLERCVELQARCLEACATMGIPHTVVHPLHHLPYHKNRELVWEMNLQYFHMLEPHAKAYGVKISLENMFGRDALRGATVPDILGAPCEYIRFYEELGSPACFTCCLDTGHSPLNNEDTVEMIKQMGGRIKLLHLNDNNFRTDDHLIPYQGLIDWESVCKALADICYDGDFTFEALHLYEGFHQEFYPVAAKYLHDVGRYMISRFVFYSQKTASDPQGWRHDIT